MARINAVLRRSEIPEDTRKRLVFDKLVIDLDSYELIVDGKHVDTPPKELELLYHLASTPNRVYTRNQLLDEVWGFDYFGDSRTVDVHIKRLREKVENVSDQWALKTVSMAAVMSSGRLMTRPARSLLVVRRVWPWASQMRKSTSLIREATPASLARASFWLLKGSSRAAR